MLMISNIESKQQAIIVKSRIIDPLFVDDQRVSQSTDLQQTIPVTTRASQARDLQTQDRAHLAKSHLGDQVLKAISSNDRGARLSLILVNDLNTCLLPP